MSTAFFDSGPILLLKVPAILSKPSILGPIAVSVLTMSLSWVCISWVACLPSSACASMLFLNICSSDATFWISASICVGVTEGVVLVAGAPCAAAAAAAAAPALDRAAGGPSDVGGPTGGLAVATPASGLGSSFLAAFCLPSFSSFFLGLPFPSSFVALSTSVVAGFLSVSVLPASAVVPFLHRRRHAPRVTFIICPVRITMIAMTMPSARWDKCPNKLA